MLKLRVVVPALLAVAVLAGCQRNPLVVKRSICPAVAVPTYAGDMTLFGASGGRDAGDVDVTATITNVRGSCSEGAQTLATDVTYDIVARRMTTTGARTVTLPVFASIVQGGNLIVSKEIGAVSVSFADGQLRAVGRGGSRSVIARSAAQVSPEVQTKISRKRKTGDIDAAIDPLADPEIRAALRAATFEVLIGFQLDESALAYNVTK